MKLGMRGEGVKGEKLLTESWGLIFLTFDRTFSLYNLGKNQVFPSLPAIANFSQGLIYSNICLTYVINP